MPTTCPLCVTCLIASQSCTLERLSRSGRQRKYFRIRRIRTQRHCCLQYSHQIPMQIAPAGSSCTAMFQVLSIHLRVVGFARAAGWPKASAPRRNLFLARTWTQPGFPRATSQVSRMIGTPDTGTPLALAEPSGACTGVHENPARAGALGENDGRF